MDAAQIVAGGEAIGWVGYWERAWRDRDVHETGWSVLPAFQCRGIAAGATALALDHARAGGRRRFVHAFPNAICRRLGFTLLDEREFEFPPGSVMRCSDWRLDLRA